MRHSISTILLVLVLLGGGCGAAYRSLRWNTPDDTALRYDFETRRVIETELETVPAGADPAVLAALRDKLQQHELALSGTLEKRKAQYFRDATSGFVITLASVDAMAAPEGIPSPLDVEGLVGKSVSVRGFDSGEVFEAIGFEHFSGYGRFGDVFADVFLQLMRRLPPELPEAGSSAVVHSEIPLQIDPLCEVRRISEVEYRVAGEPTPCQLGRTCVELLYEGWVRETGFNREPRHVTELEATGTIRGSMLLAMDVRDFQEHRYEVDIDRTIRTYEGPFDREEGEQGTVRAVVLQADHEQTVLRRQP